MWRTGGNRPRMEVSENARLRISHWGVTTGDVCRRGHCSLRRPSPWAGTAPCSIDVHSEAVTDSGCCCFADSQPIRSSK